MVALPALREVLAGRDFRRLFGVRLVGQFGDGLLQAALATFVLFSPERQPDAVKVAAAFAILLLPYSIIGPFAGVFLDRWKRRNVLVRANLLKALFTIPVIALVYAGDDGALLGLAVLIVLGIGRFVLAGLSAALPHVVDQPGPQDPADPPDVAVGDRLHVLPRPGLGRAGQEAHRPGHRAPGGQQRLRAGRQGAGPARSPRAPSDR